MKLNKIVVLTCLVFGLSMWGYSQTKPVIPKLDEKAVVLDSAGMKYPYFVWRKLLDSRDYSVKFIPQPGESAGHFVLFKLSDEMKVKRANAMARPRESPYFETGKRLKDFSVRDLDGNKYKLKDLTGKVVVLNFWFINCAPCRKEIPDLNKVVAKYKNDTDVVFLGIALDDARSLEDFLKDTPFNYNIVSDGRYEASMYGVKSYPTHVILDRKSNIIFHTNGLATNTVHWIDKSIAEGLTGRP